MTNRYTDADIAFLRANYEQLGCTACAAHLGRSRQGIYVLASRLGLRTMAEVQARKPSLAGADLEEAIRLRDAGESFRVIGQRFGLCESAASNAVLMAMGPRLGHRPATRDAHGYLLPEEIERMRLMLRKGLKAVDIQLRMGVSAACVAEQRRRYQKDLRKRDKAPLPPPGGGERYSGAKISRADRRRVEEMLLEGYGAPRASAATGVSKTVCVRIRATLIKRLARKGEALPGCDIKGRRLTQKAGLRQITPEQVAAVRRMISDGMPVRRAGKIAGVGLCSAYRIRDAINAERLAVGLPVLPIVRVTSHADRAAARAAEWLKDDKDLWRFRQLIIEQGYDAAVAAMTAEIRTREDAALTERRAQASRPLSFEEQLERVRGGAKVVERWQPRTVDPSYTLGGVATGML